MNPLNVGREGGPPVGVQRTARMSTGGVARPRLSPSGGGTARSRPGPASSMLTNNSVAKSRLVNGGPAAATANGKSSSTETKICVCWDPVPIAISGNDGDTLDETGTRRPRRSPEKISQLVQNLCYSMHLDTKQLLPTEYTEQDFCNQCFEWMDELLKQQKIITDAQGKISTTVKKFQHAVRDAQILNVGFESQPTTSSVAISEQQNLRNMILQVHRKYLFMEKQLRTNCLAPETALLGLDPPQLNQMSISRDENIRNQFFAVDGPSRSRSRSNNLETRQENPALEVNNPGSSTSNSNEENLEESAHQDDLDDEEADLQSHHDDEQGNQSVNTHGDFSSDEFRNAYDEKSCSIVMKQEISSPSMEDDSVDNENESRPESNAAVVATPRLTRVHTGSLKRKMFSQEKPKRGRSQPKKQRIIAPTSTPVVVQAFSCPTCTKQFENKKALQKHKKTHMFTIEECDICGLLLKCWGKTNMKVHKNRHMKKGEKKAAAAVIKKAKKSRGSYKKRVEKPKK